MAAISIYLTINGAIFGHFNLYLTWITADLCERGTYVT